MKAPNCAEWEKQFLPMNAAEYELVEHFANDQMGQITKHQELRTRELLEKAREELIQEAREADNWGLVRELRCPAIGSKAEKMIGARMRRNKHRI